MALKALMLRRKIDDKQKELAELRAASEALKTRETELERAIAEAETEEEKVAVEQMVGEFEADKAANDQAIADAEAMVNEMTDELADLEKEQEPAAAPTSTVERKERAMTMNAEFNVRAIPRGTPVFKAMAPEMRSQLMAREDVKEFLTRVRQMKGSTRGVTGAELGIPDVMLELIAQNVYRYSRLLQHVRVRSVRGYARQTIAGEIPEAVWTEMCGAINELSIVFNQITFDGYKVAGYIPVCNSLLEDSDLDLASYVTEAIAEAIALAEDKAIIYGKGGAAHMPLGIVTRLAQDSAPSDYPANAPAWVDLSDTHLISINGGSLSGAAFWAELMEATGMTYNRYARGELFWAMNSKTLATLRSKLITFTATGDIVANLYNALPIVTGNVVILEFIPDNDIIGGYGDLYMWVERAGMTLESSTEVQFIQDNTVFKGKARADGAPIIPQAFVAINIANTSPTTTMDFAADNANDADLQSLSIGTNTLSPTFDADVTTYTIATANAASAAVEAVPAQGGAEVTIQYAGKNVRNGGTVTLTADGQAHPMTVTVKRGNKVKVYTINITKAGG